MNVALAPGPDGGLKSQSRTGLTGNQLLVVSVLAAAIISGLSLIFVYAIDFDPSGWIVYGRESFGAGVLDTSANPAWKPFPIVVDGLFSLISSGPAGTYFWLFCARMLGVLLVFGSAALANRYAGRWAALLTAGLMVASPWWVSSTTIGQDGPPTAAFVVGAILAYQRGWVRVAGIAAVCATLLRPEAAPFAFLFAVWAWRRGELRLWEVIAGGVVVIGLWGVPTFLNTGLSPGTIASQGGVRGTPINAQIPFLAVYADAASKLLAVPTVLVVVGTVATLLGLVRRGPLWLRGLWGSSREEQLLLGTAMGWLLIVAVETIDGFSGNTRYAIAAFALFSIIAGVVAVRLAERWRVIGPVVLVLACGATVLTAVPLLQKQHKLIALRVRQMAHVEQQVKALQCPGYVWANHQNNAYVAMYTHESLPASVIDNQKLMKQSHHSKQIAYCAPVGWKPTR